MQQHGSKYFAHIPHFPNSGDGVQRSQFNFSEHVAYKIKGNDACSNMVANMLPRDPISSKVTIQLFKNMVVLHIKFN